MQTRTLYLIYCLAFSGVGRVAALPGLIPSLVAGTIAIAHPRILLQAASAGTVPYINQLQGVMNEIEGKTGRPVTYKNVEAARYIAYADANELVPRGGRPPHDSARVPSSGCSNVSLAGMSVDLTAMSPAETFPAESGPYAAL